MDAICIGASALQGPQKWETGFSDSEVKKSQIQKPNIHSCWPLQGLLKLQSAFMSVTKLQIQKDPGHGLLPNLNRLFRGKAPLVSDIKSPYNR